MEPNDSIKVGYNINEYCYEEDAYQDHWILKLCSKNSFWLNVSFIIFTTLSLFLLGTTTFVYGYFKDLRDTYGKCLIALMISKIVMHAVLAIKQYFPIYLIYTYSGIILKLLSSMGFIFSLYWLSIMCFHNLRQIKYEIIKI